MADKKKLEFGCAICGKAGEQDDLLHMVLSTEVDPDAWQQWWVHRKCIKYKIHPAFLREAREELKLI